MTANDYLWWPEPRFLLCRIENADLKNGLPSPYRENDIRRQIVMRDAKVAMMSDCGFTTMDAFWRCGWPRILTVLKACDGLSRGQTFEVQYPSISGFFSSDE